MIGMFKSFGLFFVEYQRKFSATSSEISLVLSFQTIIACAVGLIIMGIGTRYFAEQVFIVCAALFGLASSIGNAYATELLVLFLTQSTLFAITSQSAHSSSNLILGKYFKKRRERAYTIANVGGSIGGMTLPPLFAFLFEEYGLQGALIIAGGIFLHFIPIGMLMRPIERGAQVLLDTEEKEKSHNINGSVHSDEYFASNKRIEEENAIEVKKNLLKSDHRQRSSSDGKLKPVESDLLGSSDDISVTISTDRVHLGSSGLENDNEIRRNSQFKLSSLFDFSLFKNCHFILIMMSSLLVSAACIIPITYFPPFAKDRGLQTDLIGYLVTISGTSELVGRLLYLAIADSKRIERRHIMTIAMVVNGITCFMAFFSTNFTYLAIFGALQAMFGGVYFCIINDLVIDFIGSDKHKYGIAFGTVMRGTSTAITSFVVGILRDSTGSYVSGFAVMGACSILGGLILLFKPCMS
ncbi:monocarboxylate transporter 2-like [Saccostrea echinata]|uniref:monocarboxylate transporter 2-like n=1 Tax=Saccostrea echinata TaxID=191078 RepID=UPI002A81B16D|nr:monocarboxylate transporter 2-like [Saccostrea echinata]